MRIIVALCFLAAFYTVRANPLDILLKGIQNSKNQIADTTNELNRLRGNTEYKTVSSSMNALFNQKTMLSMRSDRLIKFIKDQTDAAKAKGKNVQACYDNALKFFNDVKSKATKNGDQCVDTAKSSIKNQLAFIDNIILVGEKLTMRLNSILPNCYSNNILQVQQCVAIQLAHTNELVKSWLIQTNQAESTAASMSNGVLQQNNICLANVFQPAIVEITNAMYAADTCIKQS